MLSPCLREVSRSPSPLGLDCAWSLRDFSICRIFSSPIISTHLISYLFPIASSLVSFHLIWSYFVSYGVSSGLISSDLISRHIIRSFLIMSHHVSSQRIPCHRISSYLIWCRLITPFNCIISYHTISYHIKSYHFISYHIYIIAYHVILNIVS